VAQFLRWADELVADAEPLRRHDVLAVVQVGTSLVNWSNKPRLLPARHVALKVAPVLQFAGPLAVLFRFV
jgi:hypothetical protein